MKKGFTLVELLAVIVILAVIALITIPAVMRMIDSSTMNSYRRSVDLYGGAISQAVVSYQSDMVEKGQSINVTFDNIEPYIEYEGNDVDCKIKQIYSDKTILLTECSVDEELVVAEKNKGYSDENYYYYTNSKKKMKTYEYIHAVEEELKDKNITGTCTISKDKLTCNGQDFTIKSNLENAISGTITIENNKVISYKGLKFATEKKTETNNEVPQVIDEESENNDGNNVQENLALETENYKGYYADVDGDGIVDGVIYADLAHSESGNWGGNYHIGMGSYTRSGYYSYSAQTGLKEYEVSKENSEVTTFGTNKVIKLKSGTTGNSRFYVMSLSDFSQGILKDEYRDRGYFWYYKAYKKMKSSDTSNAFGSGYINTKKIIEIWDKNGIGEGSYSGATQHDYDIWKHMQGEYEKGWYIPSIGEWVAFAKYLNSIKNNSMNKSYWSSTQAFSYKAELIMFSGGTVNAYSVGPCIYDMRVDETYYVRLGITF